MIEKEIKDLLMKAMTRAITKWGNRECKKVYDTDVVIDFDFDYVKPASFMMRHPGVPMMPVRLMPGSGSGFIFFIPENECIGLEFNICWEEDNSEGYDLMELLWGKIPEEGFYETVKEIQKYLTYNVMKKMREHSY